MIEIPDTIDEAVALATQLGERHAALSRELEPIKELSDRSLKVLMGRIYTGDDPDPDPPKPPTTEEIEWATRRGKEIVDELHEIPLDMIDLRCEFWDDQKRIQDAWAQAAYGGQP